MRVLAQEHCLYSGVTPLWVGFPIRKHLGFLKLLVLYTLCLKKRPTFDLLISVILTHMIRL